MDFRELRKESKKVQIKGTLAPFFLVISIGGVI